MNQIPNIEEGTKCRRCGMPLKDCPKTRWTNPLCVVNGVEWDEHVVGISTHHQQLQKAREQQNTVLLAYQMSLEAGNVEDVLTDIKNRIKINPSELDQPTQP